MSKQWIPLFQKLRVNICIGGFIFALAACGTYSSVVQEEPLTAKLGSLKNVVLQVSSSTEIGGPLVKDLRSYLHKKFTKAKLFSKIEDSEAVGASKEWDIMIKADIFEAMVPDHKLKFKLDLGEAKASVKVRYTVFSKDGMKKMGQFVAESSSKNKPTGGFGGIDMSNSDTSYALGRNVDAVVKYLKEHM